MFKNKNKLYIILFSVCITFIFAVLFQNCQIQKPKVELASYTITNYLHTGNETTCANCHENKRPHSSDGFIGLNEKTPFDYTTHAPGMDCVNCHIQTSTTFRTINDWSGGSWDHSPQPTSCLNCHSTQQPNNSDTDLLATNGFDHTVIKNIECIQCHQLNQINSFSNLTDWKYTGGGTDHNATASCIACHSFSNTNHNYSFLDGTTPTDSRNTVNSQVNFNDPPDSSTPKVIGSFTHLETTQSTFDCKSCHVNTPNINTTQISILANHLPPVQSANRNFWTGSANWNHASVFGLSGAKDIVVGALMGTSNSCGNCHKLNSANPTTALSNGSDLHSYPAAKNGQCGVCHGINTTGANQWASSLGGINFSHQFRNGSPFLYCTSCHPNNW